LGVSIRNLTKVNFELKHSADRGGARDEKVLTDREASTPLEERVQITDPEVQDTASVTPAIRDIARESLEFDDFNGVVAVDRLDLQDVTTQLNNTPEKEDVDDLRRQLALLGHENRVLRATSILVELQNMKKSLNIGDARVLLSVDDISMIYGTW
jgi:hypothetical protein